MIKKRHIFYIIYVIIMLICMIASLVLNPMSRTASPHSLGTNIVFGAIRTQAGDIMLIITSVLIAIAIIFLIIRKIYIRIHEVKELNRKK